MKYTKNDIINDIYDWVKSVNYDEKNADEWEELQLRFMQDAKRNLHRFLKNKEISVNGNTGTMTIGKKYKLILVQQ